MFYGGSIFSSSGFRRFRKDIMIKIFRNGTYSWYGLARTFIQVGSSVGYVKNSNITECPSTPLTQLDVSALFGSKLPSCANKNLCTPFCGIFPPFSALSTVRS